MGLQIGRPSSTLFLGTRCLFTKQIHVVLKDVFPSEFLGFAEFDSEVNIIPSAMRAVLLIVLLGLGKHAICAIYDWYN